MFVVKISNPVSDFPLERQTPGRNCRWGDFQFVINQDVEECDFWVVGEGIRQAETCRCPGDRTFFLTGEPPSVRRYNPLFLRQFKTVLTCHSNILHRNVIRCQPGLPWYIGMRWSKKEKRWLKGDMKDYDELKGMGEVQKDRMVSVITSDKAITKGHQRRLAFVRRLEKEFGNEMDVFITSGMGLEDKWDAIGRYRYHLALENSVFKDYWTEKVADPFLSLSYPFYYGCPNLADYFPADSFRHIDINDYDKAIGAIRLAIDSDLYSSRLASLQEAKRRMLDEHNVFPMLTKLFTELGPGSDRERITIRPEVVIPRNVNPVRSGWNIVRKEFQKRVR
ncbi:MAG: Glycosyltransferase family 10 (fucosyltransferase) [Methanomassiliicoccales archaeon PtaU1.Bin124]|nr:MAG: Glycosyltransferase family 10 (fucosyltransferase) [Methanomassiliicoccales archaeon PtaU1.Bin124]